MKRGGKNWDFPQAGKAASREFMRVNPDGIPEKQHCKPGEKPSSS